MEEPEGITSAQCQSFHARLDTVEAIIGLLDRLDHCRYSAEVDAVLAELERLRKDTEGQQESG